MSLILKRKEKCRLWHKVDDASLPFKIVRKYKRGGKKTYPYMSALTKCVTCGKTITIDEYGRLV